MGDRIKCSDCKFVKPNEESSDKNWTAYECANGRSEYHKALLNVTPSGDKQHRITWIGCAKGERCVES